MPFNSPLQLTPDWTFATPTPFRHTWAGLGNIDQFRWLSRADVRRHLALARDELGLRHVRAAAMYSPELAVWDYPLTEWAKPETEKIRRANWQMVDANIEGLLELGLKPIYTTCFMPVGMSDDANAHCWPDRNPTGMPRDLTQWSDFVASGIRHHIARYGLEEVRSWYFECWNEPNLRPVFFGGDRDDFFRLWSATWRAVKSVDSQLRFGGPSTARAEWLPEFIEFTRRDGTPPDYLVAHVYNNDAGSAPSSPFDGPASHRAVDSPHFAAGVVRGVRQMLDRIGWTGEVHWNEWGRSWFPHDPLRETALDAAFIAKTMSEVSQYADAFAFWCLSDVYNQAGLGASEFSGNYGMMSLHDLRKPAWFAHRFLNRLGTERVPCGGGDEFLNAIATRTATGTATLVYAYPENIGARSRREIRLALPVGAREPRLFLIDERDHNILHLWRELGSPDYPTPAQITQLRNANRLTPSPVHREASYACFTLEVPGLALIET